MAEQNPLAKYQLQRVGGPSRRNTEGMFTNVSGNAARDARRAARREQRPMTFSEMQADGIARPAPGLEMFTGPQASFDTLVPPVETYVPTTDLTPEGPLTPTATPTGPIAETPSTPSTYEAMRRAALANLQAQFGAQRQSLEESLASRGLSASSYGAGMLGDLGGQQARALVSLEAQLLVDEQAREDRRNDLLLRLAQLFGL